MNASKRTIVGEFVVIRRRGALFYRRLAHISPDDFIGMHAGCFIFERKAKFYKGGDECMKLHWAGHYGTFHSEVSIISLSVDPDPCSSRSMKTQASYAYA